MKFRLHQSLAPVQNRPFRNIEFKFLSITQESEERQPPSTAVLGFMKFVIVYWKIVIQTNLLNTFIKCMLKALKAFNIHNEHKGISLYFRGNIHYPISIHIRSVVTSFCSVSGRYFQVANIFEFNLEDENKLFANIRKYNLTLSIYIYIYRLDI